MTEEAKVVINEVEPPSQQIIKAANTSVKVEGVNGNVYTLKKFLRNQREQFLDMIGAESSQNFVYVASMLPYLTIKQIDDDDVPMPKNKMQLNALSQRIPDEDYELIIAKIEELEWFVKKDDDLKKQ